MRTILSCGAAIVIASIALGAQAATPIRVVVQSETNLAPQFVETLKSEGRTAGLTFQITDAQSEADYRVYLMQETTVGSAAAAIIVLDKTGAIVTSVVRSGRLSGHGAINACTKEVVKRIAILKK